MSKFSIILPVKNGGDYLKECVQSILTQDYTDFNLIILENASTDGTVGYLHSVNDPRIILVPSSQPLSIEENWERIVHVSKNEFMTIIGHDDLLDRQYLSVMNQLILEHPDAGLYQSHFNYIDKQGQLVRACQPMPKLLLPEQIVEYFLTGRMDIMGTGFMTRARDYDAIGGIKPYPNLLFADMELWIELARKAYMSVSPLSCFSYRTHPAATTSTSADNKVLNAFDQFIDYLEKLGRRDQRLATTIAQASHTLLQQYCQGITHKVLRTPHAQRLTPPVSTIIDQFREYGRRLMTVPPFEPLQSGKVKLGKMIDGNAALHALFLLFKRVYRRPVY